MIMKNPLYILYYVLLRNGLLMRVLEEKPHNYEYKIIQASKRTAM